LGATAGRAAMNLFAEFKRRNVFRMALLHLGVA
jgi:hypothetical protein